MSPRGMVKLNVAADEVPLLLTLAEEPAAPVVVVPTEMVAAVPVAPVGPVGPGAPVGPVGPVGPVAPVAPVGPVGPTTAALAIVAFFRVLSVASHTNSMSEEETCPDVSSVRPEMADGWIVAVPVTLPAPVKLALVHDTSPVMPMVRPVANAVAVDALPENVLAVIVFAEKLPEPSRATIALAVFALVALDVTVNVALPDWLAVKDAEPESPVPDTARVSVPLPTEAEVMYPLGFVLL